MRSTIAPHRSVQSWHHFTPTSRAEGGAMVVWYVWCFMCIQWCYSDGSWGHMSIDNLYIHLKLWSILFLVNRDLFSFIMQVIFASIRFIRQYHQSWSMHYNHHDISVVPCKFISISNVIHSNYNLIYWQGYLALFLEVGIMILFLFYLLPCQLIYFYK
jgi:hypothetical protein